MRPDDFAQGEHGADDTLRFARMTPEQRLALFFELCELMDAVQADLPNRQALRAPHPLSEESVTLWAKLMRRARHG
jgi:hypothetical protein